jgi:hypothetical protein
MDRELEASQVTTPAESISPYASGHLMCRSGLWGIAGFLGCAYFAWISFLHVSRNQYDWPHDAWTAATYVVWIVLLVALAYDTRCLREKIFFGVLVANFVVGFGLTIWRYVSLADVRSARIATGALWLFAGIVSLTTLRGATDLAGGSTQERKAT